MPDAPAIVTFLSEAIGWYRRLAVEETLVTAPGDTIFLADSRELAKDALTLAFDYARAQAVILQKMAPNKAEMPSSSSETQASIASTISNWTALARQAANQVKEIQDKIAALKQRVASAPARDRKAITTQIDAARSELDLAQARYDALQTVSELTGRGVRPEANTGSLSDQIDQLQHSVPETQRGADQDNGGGAAAQTKTAPAVVAEESGRPAGMIGLVDELIGLRQKIQTLDEIIDSTDALYRAVDGDLRAPFGPAFTQIQQQGNELAKETSSTDIAVLKQRKAAFDALIDRHKMLSAAALPLARLGIVLNQYTVNLERWRAELQQRWRSRFRSLMVRLAILAILLAVLYVAGFLWRRAIFRYIPEVHRRHQFLQARRFVMAFAVAIVLIFNFSTELGAVATVMGFAAAGIAFALQNVILSVAGYFFLIGKYGIKAGDRVQIAGVTGDVIDIGLVKLSLMELGASNGQPTGRIAVFSNAIAFQPSSNFFKQMPGTSFVWSEITLTLAPEVDYRLAEKRLLDEVNEVYARYRESIRRQYRDLEHTLNMDFDTPRPQSRLALGPSGLQITIRFPVEARSLVQTNDEISRRLLDAINREPTLKLVPQATPNIQMIPQPAAEDGSAKQEGR